MSDQIDMDAPPPGYVVWFDDEWCCWCYGSVKDGLSINEDPIDDGDLAIAAAWVHALAQESKR